MELTIELMQHYDRAYEAALWFSGLGTLRTDSQTTIVRGDLYYSKITDPVLELYGITSLDTLEAYLSTLFTTEHTAFYMAATQSEHAMIIEADGAMWMLEGGIGSAIGYSRPEFFLSEYDGDTAVLTGRRWWWSDILEDGCVWEEEPVDRHYYFVRQTDGSWRCANFPSMW